RFVAFESVATNLVAGDLNVSSDVFVRDTQTGATTRVSVTSAGAEGNGNSAEASISADGLFVAFGSRATDLVTGDLNASSNVFVHDTATGATTRVSVDSLGTEGNGNSGGAAIGGAGRFVAFHSNATNLVAGDTNAASDIFLHDTLTSTTTRVSVTSTGVEGNGASFNPSISADGRFIAFESVATNLVAGDTNAASDVFVHDTQTGTTTRVSVSSTGVEADDLSILPSISGDGLLVAFDSSATNLVALDNNAARDIFVHDTVTGLTTRVSADPTGADGDGDSASPSISGDGRFVTFDSVATNLVATDLNAAQDVFVRDTAMGVTVRVSVDGRGVGGDAGSFSPSISADGRFVAFASGASNLVAGDTGLHPDVFRAPNR
ncbi:MAG: calcium-binding protein, partial [Planctomycetota bacterium]